MSPTETSEIVVSQALVLGQPMSFDVHTKAGGYFRCSAVSTNALAPSLVLLDVVLFGRMALGDWAMVDAYAYRPCCAPDNELPVLRPGVAVRVLGRYTGLVPPSLKAGETFEFTLSAHGVLHTPAEEFANGLITESEKDYFEQPEAGGHCPDFGAVNVAFYPPPDNRASEVRCMACKARRKFDRETKKWGDWEKDVPW